MRTIVTEKPSVAREYEQILKIQTSHNNDGYIEGRSTIDGQDYRITWAIGHLVTLSYPETYSEHLKKWSLDTLPFLPEQYLYEVLQNTKKQFSVIKKLYNMPDIDTIYYAGDSGREGIYIQMLIRQMAGTKRGVTEKVVWINSQTEAEILRGIKEAQPLSEFQNLIDSAYIRAIEDYAVGINFSRAMSCKFGYQYNQAIASTKYKPLAVGRVMTCVLGMIVQREREIQNFVETVFYRPTALCGNFTARWKAIENTPLFNAPNVYENEGFRSYKEATEFIELLKTNPMLNITKAEAKSEKKSAPLLYNLAEIQNDCSRMFKLSPDETLAAIQELYEKKFVTYPRTDARVLSTAVALEINKNLKGISYLSDKAEYILNNDLYNGLEKTKYVDDSKITDHYAIIPTGEGNTSEIRGIHKDVYELIVRRFLSIFYPPAVYNKTEIELLHTTGERFFASEKILVEHGYLEIAGLPDNATAKLGEIKQGDSIHADYSVVEARTTPPKRYTSGSMILAMENAGNLVEDEELRAEIKSCGIGTSATRAEIVKKLVQNGYIALDSKTQVLKPLIAGEKLYDVVDDNIPSLLNPTMTASWQKGLSQIAEGTLDKDSYLEKMNNYIIKTVNNIKEKEVEGPANFESEVVAVCPYCGGNIITTLKGFKCEHYGKEDNDCSFYLGQIAGKAITKMNLMQLLENGKTDVIDGFKSKAGKKFAAMLVLDKEEQTINFEFPERQVEESEYECPICGELMQKDSFNLICTCGVKIPHVIAKKTLNDGQIKALLAGRTGLINGFVGKTGKKFSAVLIFDRDEKKVVFDFPERESEQTSFACPTCGEMMQKDNYNLTCSCGIKIPHYIAKKKLTDNQLQSLLSGRTEKISGFTGKSGKSFSASLVLEDGKVSFDFT